MRPADRVLGATLLAAALFAVREEAQALFSRLWAKGLGIVWGLVGAVLAAGATERLHSLLEREVSCPPGCIDQVQKRPGSGGEHTLPFIEVRSNQL